MWTIKRIDEADFGCEERLPGEPLMVLVSLECDDGRMLQLEVADNWLTMQELDEGDEWPDDPDEPDDPDDGDDDEPGGDTPGGDEPDDGKFFIYVLVNDNWESQHKMEIE